MFDMVEMNGCILKRAVKKPATEVKQVVRTMQTSSAKMALPAYGKPVKSKILPKTAPVLTPLCMMMVAATIPIPVIRPIERSVPVRRIRPATPSARNIRGDACCRMFRILL